MLRALLSFIRPRRAPAQRKPHARVRLEELEPRLAPATQLAITHLTSTNITAGSTVTFTVAAEDSIGQTDAGFGDLVRLMSTDTQATLDGNSLPATYRFVPGDNGAHTFTLILRTAGSQTITALDLFNQSLGALGQVAAATTSPIAVAAGPSSQLAVHAAGNTATAGDSVLVTAQAIDQFGNAVTSYSGPSLVTITPTPADPLVKPITGTLNSSGLGMFVAALKTTGSYAFAASAGPLTGTSNNMTVVAGAANHFTVAAAAIATTGGPTAVTVTAQDQFGNTATSYSGRLHFTSSDTRALLPADATLAQGQGEFRITLNTAGSQTITASDTAAANPVITGVSQPITTRGLTVASLTPTPTGFTATFSKPFVPGKLALYGPGPATAADATLVGAHVGAIMGSLVIDPSNMAFTFKATAGGLALLNDFQSVVLPDDTYTVTLVSSSGAHGFQDALDAGLDGANTGGHASYSTTFTTRYQDSATPVLALPDFARGPDDVHPIKVPNDSVTGLLLTLYNAAAVTDVTFTLSFSPALLTLAGGSSGDATDPASSLTMDAVTTNIDGTRATARFHYQGKAPQSGTITLGDIVATVPQSAARLYRSKELLELDNIVLNQGAVTSAASADGIHVNAYFGDVSGDGAINGLDVATAGTVAQGAATGFAAYPLVDPAVVGDVAGDLAVDASAVSDLAAFTARLPVATIPVPPGGLTITANPADGMLNLPNDSPFQNGNFNVKGDDSVEQTFTVNQSGSRTLSFLAAQGANTLPAGYQTIDVFLEDPVGARKLVGVCLPTDTQYAMYTTQPFALTAGIEYTLVLQGLDPLAASLPLEQQDVAIVTGIQLNVPAAARPQSGPPVLAKAMADFARHGSITNEDMRALLSGVAAKDTVTKTDMQSLQAVLANAAFFAMPDYVSDLASKVIDGDPANATFQTLDAAGNVVTASLGNLQVGSPGSLLSQLVRKWFLGENYPLASAPYAAAPGVLFSAGGPSYADAFQGGLEDCTVIATLAEIAARQNSVIQNMFIPVGTHVVNGATVNVWAVRFYHNGAPTYVTVDGELPGGGAIYAHPAGGVISWAALAEKAYIELNQSGWLATIAPGQNSYGALASGTTATALVTMSTITGLPPSAFTIGGSDPITALDQGKLIVLATGKYVQDPNTFTNNHAYALLSYDAPSGVFSLYNPWGNIVHATASELAANFYVSIQAGGIS
jgi:hypothetical protein